MAKRINSKTLALVMLAACAVMWSVGGLFIKLIDWNPFVISGVRSLIAGSVAYAYMLFSKQKLKLSKRSLLGAVGLCGTLTLFVCANKLTTAANAIVLQFTAPMFIVVFSFLFFKKRPKSSDLIAVLFTTVGISLLFADEINGGSMLGNVLAVCAGASFAVFYMSLDGASADERMSSIVLANVFAVMIGIPFVFTTAPTVDTMSVVYIVILGVVQLGLPYILLAKASEACSPLTCSLMSAFEPMLNPVWVMIFAGESPGFYAIVGGLVVLATISLWCVYNAWRERDAQLKVRAGQIAR